MIVSVSAVHSAAGSDPSSYRNTSSHCQDRCSAVNDVGSVMMRILVGDGEGFSGGDDAAVAQENLVERVVRREASEPSARTLPRILTAWTRTRTRAARARPTAVQVHTRAPGSRG